jgi:DNA-binding PadR family transcriptional regulator
VQLGPGTLCRTLARLAADGLVEEVPDAREDESHDAQRRYYRLSRQGRQVATREAELLERLVFAATDVGLLTRRAETA